MRIPPERASVDGCERDRSKTLGDPLDAAPDQFTEGFVREGYTVMPKLEAEDAGLPDNEVVILCRGIYGDYRPHGEWGYGYGIDIIVIVDVGYPYIAVF